MSARAAALMAAVLAQSSIQGALPDRPRKALFHPQKRG